MLRFGLRVKPEKCEDCVVVDKTVADLTSQAFSMDLIKMADLSCTCGLGEKTPRPVIVNFAISFGVCE